MMTMTQVRMRYLLGIVVVRANKKTRRYFFPADKIWPNFFVYSYLTIEFCVFDYYNFLSMFFLALLNFFLVVQCNHDQIGFTMPCSKAWKYDELNTKSLVSIYCCMQKEQLHAPYHRSIVKDNILMIITVFSSIISNHFYIKRVLSNIIW